MLSEQHHEFNDGVDFERLGCLVRVCKAQCIAEFRYPVFNLNAGVHFHKEMSVAIEDTLER